LMAKINPISFDDVPAETLALLNVLAFDAYQLGRTLPTGRVDIAFVVGDRDTGSEFACPILPNLARHFGRSLLDDLPVLDQAFAGDLTIDSPRHTVIVRLGLFGLVIDMSQDCEPEIGIVVQHSALRLIVANISIGEFLVDEYML